MSQELDFLAVQQVFKRLVSQPGHYLWCETSEFLQTTYPLLPVSYFNEGEMCCKVSLC